MMETLLTAAVVGGVAGGLAVLVLGLLIPRKSCPSCRTALPRFRKPTDKSEMLHGGWHCPNCNAKIDRHGALLKQ